MNAALNDPRFPDGIPVPVTAVSVGQVDGEDAVTFTCYSEPNAVYKHKNFATEIALLSMCTEWLEHIKVGSLFYKDRFGDIKIVSEVDENLVQCTEWTRVPGGYKLVTIVREERRSVKREENIPDDARIHGNPTSNAQGAFW